MRFKISNFSLLLLTFIQHVCSQSFEGDRCSTSTGETGICKLIGNCPSAISAITTHNIYPKTCGFKGTSPIVCCLNSGQSPQINPTISTQSPFTAPTSRTTRRITKRPPVTPTVLRPGDKSKNKCREYAKFAVDSEAPPIVDDYDWSVDDCPITATTTISGGKTSNPKEYPHMALVGYKDDNTQEIHWHCGGSLISERFILTAAHCSYSPQYGDPKYILLGDLVLKNDTDDARPQQLGISRIISHPEYTAPSSYHDIALIEMERNAILNPYVKPAYLNSDSTIHNTNAFISGWGQTGFHDDTSTVLLYALIEIFALDECTRTHRKSEKVPNGINDGIQICAGSHNTRDTCPFQGDSGGPLQLHNKDEVSCTYKIIGVTSFGKLCGNAGIPGVYTKVSSYIGWIENIVWP